MTFYLRMTQERRVVLLATTAYVTQSILREFYGKSINHEDSSSACRVQS